MTIQPMPDHKEKTLIATARTRAALERPMKKISTLHDDFISVPTWGKYMRAIGLHTPHVKALVRRSWARRT